MRSVPLMMKVPRSVIMGKSPMKTVCSLISPVCAFMNRAVTNNGRAYVMSRARQSSSEYFGGSKMWSDSSSLSWPVKSSIGEMSARTSATPCSRNHSKDTRCTAIRSGSSSTSCSLENDSRSRDAREANVTPSRRRARTRLKSSTRARPGKHEWSQCNAERGVLQGTPANRPRGVCRGGQNTTGRSDGQAFRHLCADSYTVSRCVPVRTSA